jgi:hypothetical protein
MFMASSIRTARLKPKVYDKTCELEGRRTPATGATTARFEVQLGSEILKRRELHIEKNWKGLEMENVIFAEFSNEIFKEQATSNNWNDIPSRIRHYALAWRDGDAMLSMLRSMSQPVAAFVDYDPSGMIIAKSLPRLEKIVAPPLDELAKMLCRGLAERYMAQIPGCLAALEQCDIACVSAVWNVIRLTARALPQEKFI